MLKYTSEFLTFLDYLSPRFATCVKDIMLSYTGAIEDSESNRDDFPILQRGESVTCPRDVGTFVIESAFILNL